MKRSASRLRGDPVVVAHLNESLSYELTGHRQYLIHAGMCRHWGFERLAKLQDAYWAEEVQHAAKIIARILMLGGAATPRELRPIAGAASVPEQLALDRTLVMQAMVHLQGAIADCERLADYVSRDLLVEMRDDEERHLDWLDIELALIEKLGPKNYLQSQLG